ncbi:biotin carboxyl carrier protein [Verrucomicrobium sp. GAS474]|nr:biotin carboxyl carrier protein [Verrucomicrobium sp. GAS474]
MDLKEIKAVIDLMTKNSLLEFELEKQDFKIRIKKGEIHEISTYNAPVGAVFAQPQAAPAIAAPVAAPAPAAPAAPAADAKEIVSPMVGTFYHSPSPDSAPYVTVGQEVTEDTVVCIIEAMKVMNEIKAEIRGTITEVLAENGKPVDFNKPLFAVRAK